MTKQGLTIESFRSQLVAAVRSYYEFAFAEEMARFISEFQADASKEESNRADDLTDIYNCDKCDLCEDHHD